MRFVLAFLASATLVAACTAPEPESVTSQTGDLTGCADVDGGTVDSSTIADHVFEVPAGQTLTFASAPDVVRVNAFGFGAMPGPPVAGKATVTVQQSVPVGTLIDVPYSMKRAGVDTQIGYFKIKVTAACKPPTPFLGATPVGTAPPHCGNLGAITNVPEQLDGKTFDVEEDKSLGYYMKGMPSLRQSESGSGSWSFCSPFWADARCFQSFGVSPAPGVGSELEVELFPEDGLFFKYEPSLHAKFKIRTVAAGTCK